MQVVRDSPQKKQMQNFIVQGIPMCLESKNCVSKGFHNSLSHIFIARERILHLFFLWAVFPRLQVDLFSSRLRRAERKEQVQTEVNPSVPAVLPCVKEIQV